MGCELNGAGWWEGGPCGRRLDPELLPRVDLLEEKALGAPNSFDGFPGVGAVSAPLMGRDDLIFLAF